MYVSMEVMAPAEESSQRVYEPARWLRSIVCLECLQYSKDIQARLDCEVVPLAPKLTDKVLTPVDSLLSRGATGSSGCTERAFQENSSSGSGTQERSADPEDGVAREADREGRDELRRRVQIGYIVTSVVLLCVLYYFHLFAAADESGEEPLALHCINYITKYSTVFGSSACGPDYEACKPSAQWTTVRCDGWCAQGQTDPIRVPVIGSGPFRPDSRICPAAVRAGLLGWSGGCVRMRAVESQGSFAGGAGGGVTSMSFPTWFPLALELAPADGASHCGYGGWWGILLLNIALLLGLTLLRPSRQLCWWCMIVAFYWYCLLGRMSAFDMEDVMQSLGIFALYALAAHVLLWEVGGAKVFFPDTAKGAPLEVLLLEVLPMQIFLHIQVIGHVVGDYDLTPALLTSGDTGGILVYGVGILILVPPIIIILRGWYKAGALRRFACKLLSGLAVIILLTLLFSTQNYGPHIHHYFVGLIGYFGARGGSRTAAVVRALCLGAFINGIALWGVPTGIPIWNFGNGWYPTPASVASGGSGSGGGVIRWTGVSPQLSNEPTVELSWAIQSDIDEDDNCSVAEGEGPLVVVEMNHVEVYRGRNGARNFTLPVDGFDNGSTYFYFRVGTVSTGMNSRIASQSPVLAVKAGDEPVDFYYNQSATGCERIQILQDQPRSSLAGYI